MTLRTKFWVSIAALCSPIIIDFATPKSAPGWLLGVEKGVAYAEAVILGLFILAGLVTPARVINRVAEGLVDRAARRREPAVREVPASNGIQVLGTFLDEGTDRPDERTADHYGQGGVR